MRFLLILAVFALAGLAHANQTFVRPEKEVPIFLLTNWKSGVSSLVVKKKYVADKVLPGPYFGGRTGRFCPADLLIIHGRRLHRYRENLKRPVVYVNETTGMFQIFKNYSEFKKKIKLSSTTTAFAADYSVTRPKDRAMRTYLAKAVRKDGSTYTVYGTVYGTRRTAYATSRSLKKKYGVYSLVWLDGGSSVSNTRPLPYHLAFNSKVLFKT